MTTIKEAKEYFYERMQKEPTNADMILLENVLDELHGNDFFGTEGQLDPRGDARDGELPEVYVDNYYEVIDNILRLEDRDVIIIYEEIIQWQQ